ncbi:MAG: NAD(P)/FAD-dependent oxidoreductase [Oscillospiraceae bacterium]|jgi:predicted Rossmann fold flavoprotein
MVVAVIGAGASGLMAACAASHIAGTEVLLLEGQKRAGRKLLATGNGRCNLSNRDMDMSHYHGTGKELAERVFSSFGREETLELFRGMGLITVDDGRGRTYPYSDRASSVLDVLRAEAAARGVRLVPESRAARISPHGGRFEIITETGAAFKADRVVVCTGGPTAPKLGGCRDGYSLLGSFGHTLIEPRPSISRILARADWLPPLDGIRAQANAKLLDASGQITAESCGEFQFVKDGISGPAAFDISGTVSEGRARSIVLDLLPDELEGNSEEYLKKIIKDRPSMEAGKIFEGFLHSRLSLAAVKNAGIKPSAPASSITEGGIVKLASSVSSLRAEVKGVPGFDDAQASAGGINGLEFKDSLESCLVPGLYAAGEVVDVDGDCGGYNLQWAWSSGFTAGSAAAGANR